jgi:hypothetical protein
VKQASKELLASINARLNQLDRFWEKEQTKADIEVFILDEVFAGLPTPPFTVVEKEQVARSVYAHVWQQAVRGISRRLRRVSTFTQMFPFCECVNFPHGPVEAPILLKISYPHGLTSAATARNNEPAPLKTHKPTTERIPRLTPAHSHPGRR